MAHRRGWGWRQCGFGAILVLVGTVPFENNSASARQHDLAGALNQRISQLSSEVTTANGERDRLRVELSARVSERDALAEQLAHLETIHLAEMTIMGGDTGTDTYR